MSEPHPDEAGRDRAYKVGISIGLEQASGTLMARALEAFKNADSMASELRRLSVLLKKMSDDAHPGVPKGESR